MEGRALMTDFLVTTSVDVKLATMEQTVQVWASLLLYTQSRDVFQRFLFYLDYKRLNVTAQLLS